MKRPLQIQKIKILALQNPAKSCKIRNPRATTSKHLILTAAIRAKPKTEDIELERGSARRLAAWDRANSEA